MILIMAHNGGGWNGRGGEEGTCIHTQREVIGVSSVYGKMRDERGGRIREGLSH